MEQYIWNVIKSLSVYVSIKYFFHMYQPKLLFKSKYQYVFMYLLCECVFECLFVYKIS